MDAPTGPRPVAPGHGFFTGAILEALSDPRSDRDGDGRIQLSELIDEVSARVGEASGFRQTPWVARREIFGDFTFAPAPARAPR